MDVNWSISEQLRNRRLSECIACCSSSPRCRKHRHRRGTVAMVVVVVALVITVAVAGAVS